jgi:hypothetical protein
MPDADAPRLDTIAIPTARRPGVLVRCVESHLQQARQAGRTPRFVIADDGPAADQESTRAALRDVVGRTAADIAYLGSPEKHAFVERLRQATRLPADLLAFAFFDALGTRTATHGANRNLLLAHEAGRAVLMVDDDTTAEGYRPPVHQESLKVRRVEESGPADPCECWPARSDDDARACCRPATPDTIGEHERWLARTADARGALVISGLVGDCGWGSPSAYLFLQGPSLARLTASDEAYEAAITSRTLVRAVTCPTISERADDFMSTCFAIDGRTLLPPFAPVCRGSDRVFARLLALCAPRARFVHLPLALSHRPATARRFWRGEITRSAAGVDLSMVLCALLDMLSATETPPRHDGDDDSDSDSDSDSNSNSNGDGDSIERFACCGEHLERIAGSAPEFREIAAEAVSLAIEAQIAKLEAAVLSPDVQADAYRRDARAYVAALRRTVTRADFFVPLDLRGTRSADDACTLTRRVVQQFGTLVRHWPAIAGAAMSPGVKQRVAARAV